MNRQSNGSPEGQSSLECWAHCGILKKNTILAVSTETTTMGILQYCMSVRIKPKSLTARIYCSFMKSHWKFALSYAVLQPCSVEISTTYTDAMEEWDLVRFELKMSFGRVFYIATAWFRIVSTIYMPSYIYIYIYIYQLEMLGVFRQQISRCLVQDTTDLVMLKMMLTQMRFIKNASVR